MFNSQRSLSARLIFIAFMLWGQSAVAAHELDHSWHDATELCQVFSNADNAKTVLADAMTVDCQLLSDGAKQFYSTFLIERRIVKQAARGPPLNTFIL